jgi:hypothetical protein
MLSKYWLKNNKKNCWNKLLIKINKINKVIKNKNKNNKIHNKKRNSDRNKIDQIHQTN